MPKPTATLAPLDTFRPQAANANAHTARGHAALEMSVQADGWIGAQTAAADGEIFDGSDRLDVGVATGFADAIVVESDGTRPVVVVRTDIPTATDPRAKRLALAANRVAELNLSWDAAQLAALQAEDAALLAGLFREDELAALIPPAEIVPGAGGDEFDATPTEGPTRTQPGDVWALGAHRLMDGKKAQAVVTDPPYGINRNGIMNDDPEGLRELFSGALASLPVDNAVVIAFQSPRLFPEWLDACRAAGHKFERMLWMYKSNDETFPWRGWLLTSEAILISSIGKPGWNDVHPYSHDTYTPTTLGKELPEGTGWHASVKPMDVVSDLIARACLAGATVLDPFLGSGTTLIAAHRTGRICYGCELSPAYADVVLRRAEAENIGPIELVSRG